MTKTVNISHWTRLHKVGRDTQAELLEQVTSYEARPLRQYDEKLPKELERICHKAMAKRANDRYSSAHDLADDLRHFLSEQTVIPRRKRKPVCCTDYENAARR